MVLKMKTCHVGGGIGERVSLSINTYLVKVTLRLIFLKFQLWNRFKS